MEKKQYKQVNLWVSTHEAINKKVEELNKKLKPNQKKWSQASYIDSLINKGK